MSDSREGPKDSDPQSRRKGSDRRKQNRPVDKDKRKGPRRYVAPVPIQEFELEQAVKPKPPIWQALVTKQALMVGLPALALVSAVVGVAIHEPTKRVRIKPQIQIVETAKAVKVDTQKVETARVDSSAIREREMRSDILSISPDIFYRVELFLSNPVKDEEGIGEFSETTLDSIQIYVKAKPWTALSAHARVGLLEQTFDVLRHRYPSTTRLLQLLLDDGRQLDLEVID